MTGRRAIRSRSTHLVLIAVVLLGNFGGTMFIHMHGPPAPQALTQTTKEQALSRRGSLMAALMTAFTASHMGGRSLQFFGLDAPVKSLQTLFVHPDEGSTPFRTALGDPTWEEVAGQLAKRVSWDLPEQAQFHTVGLKEFCQKVQEGTLMKYGLIIGLDLPAVSASCEEDVRRFLKTVPAVHTATSTGAHSSWTHLSRDSKLDSTLWTTGSLDGAVRASLLLIDQHVLAVPLVRAETPAPDVHSVRRTMENCLPVMQQCVMSNRCRAGLSCLLTCSLSDQPCAYRCLLSFPSEQLTSVTMCALQGQDVLNSRQQRPKTPAIPAMQRFRNEPLTKQVADDILVGHFDPSQGTTYSWLVAAASNPAFSAFPRQYQLWYHGKSPKDFLYHATFLAQAVNGTQLWDSRDYQVSSRRVPGEWEFSAMDSGMFLEEKWTLVAADDNLRWSVLYFTGLAKRAGLVYRGCIVLTKDGQIPAGQDYYNLQAAMERAGLKMWELQVLDQAPGWPEPLLKSPASQPPAPLLHMA